MPTYKIKKKEKKRGILEQLPVNVGSFQILTIIAKNLHFYVFKTLVAYARLCLHIYALTHLCRLLPLYVA